MDKRHAVIAALIAATTAGCDVTDPGIERYIIPVSDIIAPGTVPVTEPLTVRFTGSIGHNGCHRLARVETRFVANGVVVRFHGENRSAGANCPDNVPPLDHAIVLAAPRGSPFTISVEQPDGSTLDHVVTH